MCTRGDRVDRAGRPVAGRGAFGEGESGDFAVPGRPIYDAADRRFFTCDVGQVGCEFAWVPVTRDATNLVPAGYAVAQAASLQILCRRWQYPPPPPP